MLRFDLEPNVDLVFYAVGVFIAAINSIVSSRRAERQRQTELETRQAQLFMQLSERFYDRDLWEGISEMIRRVE